MLKRAAEYAQEAPSVSADTWMNCIKLQLALDAMEDQLEAAFGDHVTVKVTAEGVETEEYSHD